MPLNKNIFTAKSLLHILAGIVVNLFGLWLSTFHLPVRLNTLGTMYTACMLGPIGGSITAALTTLLVAHTKSIFIIHIFPSVAVGIICGIFYRRKNHELVELVSCVFILTATTALLNTPMNLLFRGGTTGNLWGDALFDMMTQHRSPILVNSLMAELLVDFPDMILSIFFTAGGLYVAIHYIFGTPTKDKEISS